MFTPVLKYKEMKTAANLGVLVTLGQSDFQL